MSGENFLVVLDPFSEQQPALDRAIQSAQLTSGRLQLLLTAWYDDEQEGSTDKEGKQKRRILAEASEMIASYIARAGKTGLEVSSDIVWHQDWGRAVIDTATRLGSFMIFKSSYAHTPGERSRDTMEWTLLREAPCPVLLMHNNTEWESRRILAAVNLAATDDAHQQLNDEVISIANTFHTLYDSEVHFVNAVSCEDRKEQNEDDIFFASAVPAPVKEKPKVRLDINLLKERCHCDEDKRVHLDIGNPTDVILRTAEQVNADLIIVGTVARKGIKGKIVGNMAEKLLDQTSCDILTLNHQPINKVISTVPFS